MICIPNQNVISYLLVMSSFITRPNLPRSDQVPKTKAFNALESPIGMGIVRIKQVICCYNCLIGGVFSNINRKISIIYTFLTPHRFNMRVPNNHYITG